MEEEKRLEKEYPLVSIAIITYNQKEFLRDCIDSCLVQNYPNFEIVVADDYSTDGTQEMLKKYESVHPNKIVLKFAESNQGVSKNCNIAWKSCKGEWIKTIAGDDFLAMDCLSKNYEFIKKNPTTSVVFSKQYVFKDNISVINSDFNIDSGFFDLNASEQNEKLLYECSLKAPTSFIKKIALSQVGFADERYPMIEDYPLWFKLTKAGIKLDGFDSYTVYYRLGDSLSKSVEKIGNLPYFKSLFDFQRDCIWPDLPKYMLFKKWDDIILFYQRKISIFLFKNKKNIFYDSCRIITYLLRPYRVFVVFKNFRNKA